MTRKPGDGHSIGPTFQVSSDTGGRQSGQVSINDSRDSQFPLRISAEQTDKPFPGHDVTSSLEDIDKEEQDTRSMARAASWSKTYTPEEEKTLIRKLDRRLVLFMAILYMLSFLDRSSPFSSFPSPRDPFPSS